MDKEKPTMKAEPDNRDEVGNDIDPVKEMGKGEQVTRNDLKGKKIDADPDEEKHQDNSDRRGNTGQ